MPQPGGVVVSGAVEGAADEAVLRRLIAHVAADVGPIHVGHGKPNLQKKIKGYNNAARFSPWVVLVDLNHDADCAPPFVAEWLPNPADRMCFRVAVRQIEAWLLADRKEIAKFLVVRPALIPPNPDAINNARDVMVGLAARSRRPAIRKDMVPRPGSGRAVGPAYTSRLMEFAGTHWRPDVAAGASDSLRRCLRRLTEMTGANA